MFVGPRPKHLKILKVIKYGLWTWNLFCQIFIRRMQAYWTHLIVILTPLLKFRSLQLPLNLQQNQLKYSSLLIILLVHRTMSLWKRKILEKLLISIVIGIRW